MLRSGQNYKFGLTMADSTTHNVCHRITQHTPAITKFPGRINGVCMDIDTFLDSVDYHMNAAGITSDEDKLREAKTYLDLSNPNGDISFFTQSWKFKELSTYDEYKTYLRNLYGVITTDDITKSLSRIVRQVSTSDDNYIQLGGSIYQQLSSWKHKAQNSVWFQNGSIKIDDLCKLLHLSMTLSHLPKELVASFKDPFLKTHDLASVRQAVKEHRNKIPNLDTSRLDEGTKLQVAKVNVGQRRQEKTGQDRTNQNRQSSGGQNRTAMRQNFRQYTERQCQYCHRTNHTDRNCFENPKFCSFHNSFNHAAKNCNAIHRNRRQISNRQSRSPNRSDRYDRNHRYRSVSKRPFDRVAAVDVTTPDNENFHSQDNFPPLS